MAGMMPWSTTEPSWSREGKPDVSSPQRFAEETLRTLCLASREVSEAEYGVWSRRHHEASVLLQDRARELDRLYDEMEQNLQVGRGRGLGGTLGRTVGFGSPG